MAALVFATNALSGLSAHIYIWTGRAVAGSVNVAGMSTIKATIPINNNGADSPKALAKPIIVPVKIPGIAEGSKCWNTTCISDAPIARAASLIEGGTDWSDDLVAIIIVGRVIKDNTRPPTKGTDLGIPKKFIKTAKPNKPKIIDGTAARLFILTSIKSVIRFFIAKFSKYMAV